MAHVKTREKQKTNKLKQIKMAKSFFDLIYKEKLFRMKNGFSEFKVIRVNSQYQYHMVYENDIDNFYRVILNFKVSGYCDLRVYNYKGFVAKNRFHYPKSYSEIKNFNREIVNYIEKNITYPRNGLSDMYWCKENKIIVESFKKVFSLIRNDFFIGKFNYMIFKKSKKHGISLLYRDPENTCSEIKAFKNKDDFVDFYFLKGSLSRIMGYIKINIDTTENIHNIKNIQIKNAITKLNNVKSFIIDDYNVIDFTSDSEID